MRSTPTIVEVMEESALFRPWFVLKWLKGDTWAPWKVFLKALYGLAMSAADLKIYEKHTGRAAPPTEAFTKAWLACGRRSGKSRIAALIAVYNAVFRKYPTLQRGEVGVMPIIASDRNQSGVIFGYVNNFFRDVPLLAEMVVSETKDSIELNNGIKIEVHTSDYRSLRGYTMIGGIYDELAFWPTDEHSVSPDTEILNAVEKGSANVPAAMHLGLSSPYARQGALYEAYERNFGKETDELVWQADTKSMNPTIEQKWIDKQYAKDPAAAIAEIGAQFRDDVAGFLSMEVITACIVPGRYELPPIAGESYFGFCDPSGSSSDSMTLAIAHVKGGAVILDLLREVTPRFDPESVVEDFCATLKRYRCFGVTGDNYAAAWVSKTFERNRISYTKSALNKSDIYLSFLPAVNSGQVMLLDHARLKLQLAGLVRMRHSGGKDKIDHRPSQHDDCANAAAGALWLAAEKAELDIGPMLAMMQREAMKSIQPVWAAQREAMCRADAEAACPRCGAGPNLVHRVAGGSLRCLQCGLQWGAPKYEFPEIARRRF